MDRTCQLLIQLDLALARIEAIATSALTSDEHGQACYTYLLACLTDVRRIAAEGQAALDREAG